MDKKKSIQSFSRMDAPFSYSVKLEIGLEPTTPSLRVKCSTD